MARLPRGYKTGQLRREGDKVACTITISRWRIWLLVLRAIPRVLKGIRISWR